MKKISIILLVLIGLIFAAMLTSCGAYRDHIIAKHCPKQSSNIKDSIVYHTKDSTIYHYKDSVRISIKDSINIINRDSVTVIKGGKADITFNPLDSAKCALRVFSQKIISGNNTTMVESDGKNIHVKSNCDDQINYWKSLYINSNHSEEVDHWKELNIKEKHLSDSLKVYKQTEVIVKVQEHTMWEKLKLSAFGDISVIALCVLIVLMGWRVYQILKKVTP